jgi:two-component system sensor histidine kinase/response regulator
MRGTSAHPFFDLTGRKVLVVANDQPSLRLLSGILRPAGYEVAEAGSGEAALETYASFVPDLVLLDVELPGINGLDTCRALKQRYRSACALVVFITAQSESDDVVEGLAAGGVDCLLKPIRPKEMLARIRAHLQNRLLVEQLNKTNAAKDHLMGMAAHDLRNPLASTRGLTEFLRDGTVGPLTPDQLELVNNIHEASQSMLELVNELLDVAIIGAGELRIHLEPAVLEALIEKSIYLNNINAARKGTRIVRGRGTLPASLPLDILKIRQVLDNLFSNAIKFSPPSSTITVQTENAAQCRVSVRDQGPGIPEGEHDQLFKNFGRTSVKPTGGEKSTGLGLAICRKIMEAHGGTIGAANLAGGGCEFTITFPRSTLISPARSYGVSSNRL